MITPGIAISKGVPNVKETIAGTSNTVASTPPKFRIKLRLTDCKQSMEKNCGPYPSYLTEKSSWSQFNQFQRVDGGKLTTDPRPKVHASIWVYVGILCACANDMLELERVAGRRTWCPVKERVREDAVGISDDQESRFSWC